MFIIQVLQALFITLGVFTGLTLFTFQTKVSFVPSSPRTSTGSALFVKPTNANTNTISQYDFSSFAPFLFAGIWGLLTASLVSIFLPFNANTDLAIAGFSVLLFSGFVLYDTQQIMKRLSVDEAILVSVFGRAAFLVVHCRSCCWMCSWIGEIRKIKKKTKDRKKYMKQLDTYTDPIPNRAL